MKEVIDFFRRLHDNNDRAWFDAHRAEWAHVKGRFAAFTEQLIAGIAEFDPTVRGLRVQDCTYRIARDTRFSPDKSPYKTYIGAYIAPKGKKSGFAGYYFHIEPCCDSLVWSNLLSAGLYCPEPVVLRSVREEILDNGAEIAAAIRKAKTDSQTTITQKEQAIREATEKRLACQQKETEALAKARTASDSREEMGREMARLAERKAAAESEYDATAAKLWDEYQLTVSQAEELCVEFDSLPALRAQVADLRNQIRALGNVNVSAIEEYQEVRERYDALSAQVADVEGSRNELTRMIASLSGQMKEIFTDSFRAINENFGRIFAELFGGGEASLVLEDESDVLSCGIGIQVAPPGKVIKNLEALSGGEQALVAISIYFAILAVNPAPFCILDEIEAALDDANVVRFAQYLRRISDKTQFIVITHRRGTMEAANVLYGVTMQEDGVSKLLKLDLEQVDATLVS